VPLPGSSAAWASPLYALPTLLPLPRAGRGERPLGSGWLALQAGSSEWGRQQRGSSQPAGGSPGSSEPRPHAHLCVAMGLAPVLLGPLL
jgi:hypothetical protein